MKIETLTGRKLTLRDKVTPDPRRPDSTAAVGIEIELEGLRTGNKDFRWWNVVGDGSLQHGIEFVSYPVGGKQITSALNEVKKWLAGKKPYVSFRTSVHVHLNVLDMEQKELVKLIELYLLYEPALFRMHEEWGRYDNIFCVPARKSYAIQEGYAALCRDLTNDRVGGPYVGYKYSALNPNPVSVLGTLEFRHMGGTADVSEISRWIDILLRLRVAARSDIDIDNAEAVFGEHYDSLEIHDDDIFSGQRMIENIQLINIGA